MYMHFGQCTDCGTGCMCVCYSIKAMFLLIDCKNRMTTKSALTLSAPGRAKLPNGVSALSPYRVFMLTSDIYFLQSSSPITTKNIDYGDVGEKFSQHTHSLTHPSPLPKFSVLQV